MMKKLLVAGATALALLSPLAAAPPAAASPGHVTINEFRQVKKPMSMQRAHRIFDISGRQGYFISGSRWCAPGDLWACASQSREYRTKSRWGTVYVDYIRYPNGTWRVASKSAFWG